MERNRVSSLRKPWYPNIFRACNSGNSTLAPYRLLLPITAIFLTWTCAYAATSEEAPWDSVEAGLSGLRGHVIRSIQDDISGWMIVGSGLAGLAVGPRSGPACRYDQWLEEQKVGMPIHDCYTRQQPSYFRFKKGRAETFASAVIIGYDGREPIHRIVDVIALSAPMDWPTWSWKCSHSGNLASNEEAVVATVRFHRCEQFTADVRRAWKWDMNNLTLKPIRTKGLVCEDIEYGQTLATENCKR